MYLRALEFSSQENEQPPKLGSCSRIYFCKEYSKANLCGKERILLAKMVPKYTNRNAISLVYIQMNPCQAFKYNNDDFSVVIFRRPCYNNGWFLTKCRRRTLCQTFSKCISFTAGSTTRSRKSKAHIRRTLFRLLRWKAANTKAPRTQPERTSV